MTMDTTVIIPTFNRRPFLREALNSVRAQICSPKTTIVIDDGGEDESWREVPEDSPGFNYVYQTNSGVSSARNLGVKRSTASYVSFLDSDDLWEPHFLQVHKRVFQLFPDIGCIMSDFVLTDIEGIARKRNQGFSGGFPIFSETGYDPVKVFGDSLQKEVLAIDDARYPNGFQLSEAEVGNGTTDLKAGIELHLSDSHAHFASLHMNQDGVIR